MTIDSALNLDLETIAQQETLLQFQQFDQTTAWIIGLNLKELCERNGVCVAIEIRLNRDTVFFYAMPGTTPSNRDWARRKRNTVELLHQSSYAVGLALAKEQSNLHSSMGLNPRDFASHGGSFPIYVQGVGCVGAVTISGLPQRQDHNYVVTVLSNFLKKPLDKHSLN